MSIPSTISLTGDVTIFEVAEWKQRLLTEISSGHCTLDLSGVGHVDASGAQLLMAAHRTGRLILARVPPATAEAFTRLGWDSFKQGT